MTTEEKVKEVQALTHFLSHLLRRHHFGYVGFERVRDQSGVNKDKAIDILNILADAGLVDFEFDPWTPGKHSLEYYSPEVLKTGYFNFVSKEIREQESNNAVARVRLYKDARANYTYIPEIERRMNELSKISNSEEVALKLIKDFKINKEKLKGAKSCEVNGLTLSLITGDTSYKGKTINLPLNGQVYKALQILMTSEENVSSCIDLLAFIFNTTNVTFTTKEQLQKIISNLRKELAVLGIGPKAIRNTKGTYRLKL